MFLRAHESIKIVRVHVELNGRDNEVLASLLVAERRRLQPLLERVEIESGKVVIEPDEPFVTSISPIDLVTSTLQELSNGSSVETGLVGMEGVVGIQYWLQQETTPSRTIVQIAGTALRMTAPDFKREVMEKPSPLNRLIAGYVHAFLTMTGQTAVCNRMHEVNTRLARWLSLVHDRVQTDEFFLRHEFLAMMLGVHRPAVTIAANTLQSAGLISYRRGSLTVQDPRALRESACECYAIIEAVFDKMYGADWRERAKTSTLPV